MVKSWSRDCSCDHGCYIHCVTRIEGNFGLCYQQHCRFPHKSATPRPSTLRLCCHLSGECEHFMCPGSTCQKRLAYILGDTLCCKGSSAVRQRAWEKSWHVGSVGKVHIFFCNASAREADKWIPGVDWPANLAEVKLLCSGLKSETWSQKSRFLVS